ncbi:MAG: dockerin type I repeat-containing protein [Clostridiales bacterium]|nr:dockerin type I repeat-containing protein [Clostridiales bacterium]
MVKSKKVLSFLLAAVMIICMLPVSATALINDKIMAEYEDYGMFEVTVGEKTDLEWTVDLNGAKIKEIELNHGEIPEGMDWDYKNIQKLHIYGTPAKAGNYVLQFKVTLDNGESFNYSYEILIKTDGVIFSDQTVYLHQNEDAKVNFDIDSGIASYYKVELVSGDMPDMTLVWNYSVKPYYYAKPANTGEYTAIYRITLYDGRVIVHTITVIVVEQGAPLPENDSMECNAQVGEETYLEWDYDNSDGSEIIETEFIEGELPEGMEWSSAEDNELSIYGTPTRMGRYDIAFKVTLENGKIIYYTFKILVVSDEFEESSETVRVKINEDAHIHFKDGHDDSYYDIEYINGEIPEGMEYTWGNAEAGYRGVPVKEGEYTATYCVILFNGRMILHTITVIVYDGDEPSMKDSETDNTDSDVKNTDTENTDVDKLIYGDVTGDGKVTMDDVVMIQKEIAKLVTFNETQMKLGDTDGNEQVTMADVVLIQQYIAKLTEHFPVEAKG